jgi:hypothetical protein
MKAFLLIASLSLVFYLGLLVALHLDSRKRRVTMKTVRQVKLGTVAELSTAAAMPISTLAGGRGGRATVFVGLEKGSPRQMPKLGKHLRASGSDQPSEGCSNQG